MYKNSPYIVNVPHANKTVTDFGGIYRYTGTPRRYAPVGCLSLRLSLSSKFGLEVCKLLEFPRVPWHSHGNGNVLALFVGIGKRTGMIEWAWEGMGMNSALLENSRVLGYPSTSTFIHIYLLTSRSTIIVSMNKNRI